MNKPVPATAQTPVVSSVEEVVRRQVLLVTVNDESGVLARVVELMSGRGYNIDQLTVGRAVSSKFAEIEGGIARMTIVITCSDQKIEQIASQIGKLIPVLDVENLTDNPDRVEADITLVKALTDDPHLQTTIAMMAQSQFRGMSIRTKPGYIVLRFVGQERAATDFVGAINRFGVQVESVHSGIIAIA